MRVERDGADEALEKALRPVRGFVKNKLAGAIVLVSVTGLALALVNSPWADRYRELREVITFRVGGFELSKPLLRSAQLDSIRSPILSSEE